MTRVLILDRSVDPFDLAEQGATVVVLDASKEKVDAARRRADELGLTGRVRVIHSDLADARRMLPEPESFDRVEAAPAHAELAAWFLKHPPPPPVD